MKYVVYVIVNQDNMMYIGQTNNLADRLVRHNSGRNKSTKNRGPYTLIYSEEFESRAEAMQKEKVLKMGQGRQWLKDNFLKK